MRGEKPVRGKESMQSVRGEKPLCGEKPVQSVCGEKSVCGKEPVRGKKPLQAKLESLGLHTFETAARVFRAAVVVWARQWFDLLCRQPHIPL
ncbi:MAG: hypothetical protein ACE5EM_11925 [Sphingomonadales bacterium]